MFKKFKHINGESHDQSVYDAYSKLYITFQFTLLHLSWMALKGKIKVIQLLAGCISYTWHNNDQIWRHSGCAHHLSNMQIDYKLAWYKFKDIEVIDN